MLGLGDLHVCQIEDYYDDEQNSNHHRYKTLLILFKLTHLSVLSLFLIRL